jgi:hypothetical protein
VRQVKRSRKVALSLNRDRDSAGVADGWLRFLVLFAGTKEKGFGAVLAAETLAVFSKDTLLADYLKAQSTLQQPHCSGRLSAFDAHGHFSRKYSRDQFSG